MLTFFLEEHVDHSEQVLLGVLLPDDLGDFVQALRQGDLDLLVLALQQLLVDFVELGPAVGAQHIGHSREVERAAIHDLVFAPDRVDVVVGHPAKLHH